MSYRILGQSLWPTANAVRKYFKETLGLATIKVEEEIAKEVPRPTLHAKSRDQAFICAEFLEAGCFSLNIERFVSACKAKQLPVRLFVVFPEGAKSKDFGKDFRAAREHGVGVISVSEAGEVNVLAEPISITLSGLRKIDPKAFPAKYKGDLMSAQQTYLNGNPAKGCAAVYDIIEALTRRVAAKLHSQAWVAAWSSRAPRFEKAAWFKLADDIYRTLDFNRVPRQERTLWAKIVSLTNLRNESGHEPKTMKERVARDKELRTRFEDATDVLRKLIEATKDLAV